MSNFPVLVRHALDWVLLILSGSPPDALSEQTRRRLEALMIVVCVLATAVFVYALLLAISD